MKNTHLFIISIGIFVALLTGAVTLLAQTGHVRNILNPLIKEPGMSDPHMPSLMTCVMCLPVTMSDLALVIG